MARTEPIGSLGKPSTWCVSLFHCIASNYTNVNEFYSHVFGNYMRVGYLNLVAATCLTWDRKHERSTIYQSELFGRRSYDVMPSSKATEYG